MLYNSWPRGPQSQGVTGSAADGTAATGKRQRRQTRYPGGDRSRDAVVSEALGKCLQLCAYRRGPRPAPASRPGLPGLWGLVDRATLDLRCGLGRRCAGDRGHPACHCSQVFQRRAQALFLVLSLYRRPSLTSSGPGAVLGDAPAAAAAEVTRGTSLGYAGNGIPLVGTDGALSCSIQTPGSGALTLLQGPWLQ